MSTEPPKAVEGANSILTTRNILAALVVGAVGIAIGITVYNLAPSDEKPAENENDVTSPSTPPIQITVPSPSQTVAFNVNSLDDDFLQSAKSGKVTLEGDDQEGTKAKALQNIASVEGVNAAFLKRLSEAKFNPAFGTNPPEGLSEEEKTIFAKLKIDDLRKVYAPVTNVPIEKDVTVQSEEEKQAKEMEEQATADAERQKQATEAAELKKKEDKAVAEKKKIEEAEKKRLEKEEEERKTISPEEVEKQRIEALKAEPALEIDLVALKTADDANIQKAFDFMQAENFTIKNVADDTEKTALIQAINAKQLSLELFKKLVKGTAGPAEETALDVLRQTPVLKATLNVPDREQTPREKFADFKVALYEYSEKYTDSASPTPEDKAAITSKLSDIVALATSIDVATAPAEIQTDMSKYKPNLTVDDLAYAHLKATLDKKILDCKADSTEAEKYVTILRRDFFAKFNADYHFAANALSIPDVQLRVLAFGTTWDTTAVGTEIAKPNFQNPLSADAKAAFTAFIDKQALFKLYFETVDKATLDAGLREAVQLKANIATYSTAAFIDDAKSTSELTKLKARLSQFQTDHPALALALAIPDPPKNAARTDPNTICQHHYNNFITQLELFQNDRDKVALAAKFASAATNCNISAVTLVNIKVETGKAIPAIVMERFDTALIAGKDSLTSLTPAEIAALEKKLEAVRMYVPDFKTSSPDNTAKKILCTDAADKLQNALTGMKTNVLADVSVESTKLSWNKCATYCEATHALRTHASLKSHLEAEIQTLIKAAVATNIKVTRDENITIACKVVDSLKKLEAENRYKNVTIAFLNKFVNFSQSVQDYIANRNFIWNHNLISPIDKTKFVTSVSNNVKFVPLDAGLENDHLEITEKQAYDELVTIQAAGVASTIALEAAIDNFLFTKLDVILQEVVIAKKEADIKSVCKKMSIACKDKYEAAYKDDIDFDEIMNSYKGSTAIKQESKNRLKEILVSNKLKLQIDKDPSLLRAIRLFVDFPNVLESYFRELPGATKTELTEYFKAVGHYLNNLETPYPIGEIPAKFTELLKEHLMLDKLRTTAVQTKILNNPLPEAPKLEDLTRKLTDACKIACDNLKAAFEDYVADGKNDAKRTVLVTAFNKVAVPCADDTVQKLVVEATLVEYVGKIFNALLAQVRTPNADLPRLRNVSAVLKKLGGIDLDEYYKDLFMKEYGQSTWEVSTLKEIMENWRNVTNVVESAIAEKAEKLVEEKEMKNIWTCYYETIDGKKFNDCQKTVYQTATKAVSIFTTPFIVTSLTPGTINRHAFEMAAENNIKNVDIFFDGKNENALSVELSKFKKAIERIAVSKAPLILVKSAFTPTSAIVKSWTEVIKDWNSKPTKELFGTFRAISTKYEKVDQFFGAVLEKYWETVDQDVYKHAQQVFRKLNKLFPVEFSGTIENRFFDPLRKKSKWDKVDLNAVTVAINSFDNLGRMKTHLNAWHEAKPEEKDATFFLAFINATDKMLLNYSACLTAPGKTVVPPGRDETLNKVFKRIMDDRT